MVESIKTLLLDRYLLSKKSRNWLSSCLSKIIWGLDLNNNTFSWNFIKKKR